MSFVSDRVREKLAPRLWKTAPKPLGPVAAWHLRAVNSIGTASALQDLHVDQHEIGCISFTEQWNSGPSPRRNVHQVFAGTRGCIRFPSPYYA